MYLAIEWCQYEGVLPFHKYSQGSREQLLNDFNSISTNAITMFSYNARKIHGIVTSSHQKYTCISLCIYLLKIFRLPRIKFSTTTAEKYVKL